MKNINSKLLLAIILTFTMLLGMVSVTAFAADGTTVYLEPGADWQSDGARFAVYYWSDGSGDGWVDMTNEGEGIYKAVVPAGYSNIIFCRMNPDTTENTWDNKWNQTVDLTISADDTFTISDPWAALSGGTWASGADVGGNTGDSGDSGSVEVPSADGISLFTVAGVSGLCGAEWDPSYSGNDMTYNAKTGLYEKTFTGIPAGTYEFKVAANHGWDKSWGDPINGVGQYGTDYQITINEELNVTVTFNPTTCEVSYYTSESTGPSDPAPSTGLEDDVEVFLENAAGWGTVYVYYWGGETTVDWCGIMMDYDEDKDLWYATVPAGSTGIIFNDGNGVQTKDIVVMPTEANNYFVNDDLNGDFVRNPNYVEPTPEEPAGLNWLQEIALSILLFLRSIEDFFKGLFGG